MTSRSEYMPSMDNGFSLFEVMVSLAILALVTSVGIASLRPPSQALELERSVSETMAQVAQARLKAIRKMETVVLEFPDARCETEKPVLYFFADGTAFGQDLCLEEGDVLVRLVLDNITGRLAREVQG